MDKTTIAVSFTLDLGYWAKPIAEQLAEQGVLCRAEKLEEFQQCANAISMLMTKGLLPAQQAMEARQKLTRWVNSCSFLATDMDAMREAMPERYLELLQRC